MILTKRNRTSANDIGYGLYLYFLGLSYRNTAKALSRFKKRSHVSIWKWIQKYKPEKIFYNRMKISKFIVDETQIKVGKDYFWLCVPIKPKDKDILHIHIHISTERNMFVAEYFLRSLVKKYGRYPVSTDGGAWYPQACKFLQIKHHLHSLYEKNIIERRIQYIKDRTECFDDYFPPCRKEKCRLEHIINWFHVFVDYHNKEAIA